MKKLITLILILAASLAVADTWRIWWGIQKRVRNEINTSAGVTFYSTSTVLVNFSMDFDDVSEAKKFWDTLPDVLISTDSKMKTDDKGGGRWWERFSASSGTVLP